MSTPVWTLSFCLLTSVSRKCLTLFLIVSLLMANTQVFVGACWRFFGADRGMYFRRSRAWPPSGLRLRLYPLCRSRMWFRKTVSMIVSLLMAAPARSA
jgi:hypothetical protein